MSLKKTTLNINGTSRAVLFDSEKDSLADVLRRMGLTGTKVGCHTGVCGACSVVLDGKVIRSCTKKMAAVAENASVTTIEGIGTPQNLHPLQRAWITCGGVQCGFCTPGFIVSAYGLLLENPSPTRKQVRDWFQQHRNACRCTGYKPLVDAVMAAAAVMRGDAPESSLDYSHTEGDSYYNGYIPRPSAVAKVCGLLDYGEDVTLKMPADTLHLALVQPRAAHHARVLGIDMTEALSMPGVVKIVTAKDVKGNNLVNQFMGHKRSKVTALNRPIINSDTIYRYGDVVAVVVADTREHARAAAQKVKVDIERLPEYLSYLEAVVPGAERIHKECDNIYVTQPVIKGELADGIIERSAFSCEGSFRTPREPHLSIEGDIVQAYVDEDGGVTVHCKSQAIKMGRAVIAKGIGIDEDKLRFVHNGVGGSFGWSTNAVSYAITAICAMEVQRPVSLEMSYEEFMHFSGKRTASHINGRLACDAEGKITALEYEAGIDHGAYSEMADSLMQKFAAMGSPYYIPNVSGMIRTAYTNHNVGVAYRGYGYPQSSTAIESMMDMLAEKVGVDPFEFRYNNLLAAGQTTVNGYALHEDGCMRGLMDAAREHYYEMKKRAHETSTPEKLKGVGAACCMFKPCTGPFDHAEVALELMPDNTITNYNTWEDVGQGGDVGSLVLTLEALKPLGLKPEQVHLCMNDSQKCPDTGIAAASRSHFMAGTAIIDAADKLLKAMKKEGGGYRTYDEMTAEGIPVKYLGVADLTEHELSAIDPNTGMGDPSPTGMYGVCLAEVEVDVKTGKTAVTEMSMWADAGVIGNKLSAEGQAYGGMSHCIGYALSEDYDDVKKHDNILRAGIPYANDVPDNYHIYFIETPRKDGPFGASGLAELFQSAEHMAVINGIYHASGVRIFELPAYPEKVKAGLEKLARGEAVESPERYYLGPDMYEELEDAINNPV